MKALSARRIMMFSAALTAAVFVYVPFSAAKWNLEPCVLALRGHQTSPNPFLARALNLAHDGEAHSLEVLREFIAIPSISSAGGDPAEVQRGADRTETYVREIGLKNIRQVRVGNSNPFILAESDFDPSRPTILFYNHYDVVAPGELEKWESKPFEMTVRGGKIYGRGVVDNKGGMVATAEAIRALMKASEGGRLPVNIRVLFEGEEEIGSPNVEGLTVQHPEFFAGVDSILIPDGGNAEEAVPTVDISLRGMLMLDVKVTTLKGPLHSGIFGIAPNAFTALIVGIGRLVNDDGTIAIPEVMNMNGEISPDDRRRFQDVSRTDAGYAEMTGMVPGAQIIGRPDLPLAYRVARQPGIIFANVKGSEGGTPSVSAEASARIAIRFPPGADPDRIQQLVETHLRRNIPFRPEIQITRVRRPTPAWSIDSNDPYLSLMESALQGGYRSTRVLRHGSGGGLPLVSLLASATSNAPNLIIGADDPQSSTHGFNENMSLISFRGTRDTIIHFAYALGRATPLTPR